MEEEMVGSGGSDAWRRRVGWCVRVWGGGSVDEERVATLVLWCFRSESGHRHPIISAD